MLARLTMKTVHLLDIHIESAVEHLKDWCYNVDRGSSLVFGPEHSQHPSAVASQLHMGPVNWGMQHLLVPIYRNLQQTICSDIEDMTLLLLELENNRTHDKVRTISPAGFLEAPESVEPISSSLLSESRLSNRFIRERRPSSDNTSPIVIPSVHPSTPTIIITLSSFPPDGDVLCRVPLQNNAFGDLLTVPLHPAFNKNSESPTSSHPNSGSLPLLSQWRMINGRRHVVVPTLEEQARSGMFSRPINPRRKAVRKSWTNSSRPEPRAQAS